MPNRIHNCDMTFDEILSEEEDIKANHEKSQEAFDNMFKESEKAFTKMFKALWRKNK